MKQELTKEQKWDLFFSVLVINNLLPIIIVFIKNYLDIQETISNRVELVLHFLIVIFLTLYIYALFTILRKFWYLQKNNI